MSWHLLWVFLSLSQADIRPVLIDGEELLLKMPAAIFEDKALGEHLFSGLTTTFQMVCRRSDRDSTSIAYRIDIRYEPWDEIFFVNLWDSRGEKQAWQLADKDKLTEWWTTHRFNLGQATPGQKTTFGITLTIIPFSQQEQQKARDWLTYQNDQPDGDLFAGRLGRNGGSNQNRQSNLLRIMLATSIQRDAIKRYRWKVVAP